VAGTGHLERAVLQVLWDQPGPAPARDVLAALTRFLGSVSPADSEHLRAILAPQPAFPQPASQRQAQRQPGE
jgi:hypothetical protein